LRNLNTSQIDPTRTEWQSVANGERPEAVRHPVA
jgi:hypothetical protein